MKKNPKEKTATEEVRTLGALLRLPYQALAERLYTELAATGFSDIRPAHSNVFRHILPGGSRITDMAERSQMTKQSMAYLVDYLYEHGYVEFVPDPEDGRAKLVRLTQRGLEFQQAAINYSHHLETEVTRIIGTAEMAQLRKLLEQLTDCLSSDKSKPLGSRRHDSTQKQSRNDKARVRI